MEKIKITFKDSRDSHTVVCITNGDDKRYFSFWNWDEEQSIKIKHLLKLVIDIVNKED